LVLVGCTSEPHTIRADFAPPVVSVAPAPPPAPPQNPQLDCYAWLNAGGDGPGPFPYPVHPGLAMGLVLDWAERHHEAEQPSIWSENVSCPKERCVEPDDCWFSIRLDDSKSTATSHLVRWLEVDARSGDVRWKDVGADGEWVVRVERPPHGRGPRLAR
jgi:hypothetical protein